MSALLSFFFPFSASRIGIAHHHAAMTCLLVVCLLFLPAICALNELLFARGWETVAVGKLDCWVMLLYFAVLSFSALMLCRRRLHDVGISGVPALALFVPVLGWIPLIFLCLLPGTKGANDYGVRRSF